MKKVFGDETVFITGAAGGLGSAMAHILSQYCKMLVLIDINEDELRRLQIELATTTSCNVTHKIVDLSSEKSVEDFLTRFNSNFNFSGILINNAGISTMDFAEQLSMGDLRKMMEVNFFAVARLTQFFVQSMRNQHGGRIITIASGSGVLANYGGSGYCASKGAVVLYMEALRQELAGTGIKTHTVLLPTVMTEFHQDVLDGKFGDMAKSLPTITPEVAARELLKQVVVGREVIAFTPTLLTGLILNGIAPSLLRTVMGINGFLLNCKRKRV